MCTKAYTLGLVFKSTSASICHLITLEIPTATLVIRPEATSAELARSGLTKLAASPHTSSNRFLTLSMVH